MPPKKNDALSHVQKICLALPDTQLKMSWGSPHFFVGKKIFAGCDEKSGTLSLTIKLEPEHSDLLLTSDPRFKQSRYQGAIELDLSRIKKWDEVEALIQESYRLVAPKTSQAKLSDP